ncbi:MAG: hypothetical protein ACYTF4_11140 [Planctomycetota bacterium]|jgi:hypothetical protein
MSRLIKVILALAAVTALAWLGWAPVQAGYINKSKNLKAQIASLTDDVDQLNQAASEHIGVSDGIRGYVNRTLGGDLETVDHRLRSRLNRIGEELGLEALTVGTGRVRQLDSPAKNQFRRRGQQTLRDELDFVEVEAWISGQGSLEGVLRLIHWVEAEPWLKRVQQVRVQPKLNAERFAVQLRLVTLYLPDRAPDQPPPAGDPQDFGRYASMASRNPFQVPPPNPEPTPDAAAAAGPDAGLGQWVLTGVAANRGSVEAWLLNPGSGESRRLALGDAIQEAVLVAANGNVAEFRLGDERFRVAVGSRLTERLPPRP